MHSNSSSIGKKNYPRQPGVYLMKNAEGQVLYVGKAKNLKLRIGQYFVPGRDGRMIVPFLTSQIASIDTIVTPTEREALLLENTLIKRHQPKYNVLLRDDKTFISLLINNQHEWPMVRLVRYKGMPKKDGLYFGPYTSALSARETFKVITSLFPLRQCSDNELKSRKRPCLLYMIKRCMAPCTKKCDRNEYNAYVQKTIKFLKGQSKEITEDLKKEMGKASDQEEYEKAGALLKTIRQLETVSKQSKALVQSKINDCDALGIYREQAQVMLVQILFRDGRLIGSEQFAFSNIAAEDEEILESFILQNYVLGKKIPKEILLPFPLKQTGLLSELLYEQHKHKIQIHVPLKGEKKEITLLAKENAKALFAQKGEQSNAEELILELEEALNLSRCPIRMECFDTSHIAASDPVACMIAFTDGQKDSSRTRLYKIKTVNKGDDYAAMKEVLTRRYTKAKLEDDLPDLVIVDGGKGQLNIAMQVFRALDIANVDLIAVTKEAGRHDKGITKEKVYRPHEKTPLSLPPHSPLLFLLQQIRDEAHRVAIGFHRKRRKKRIISSALDTLPGIGPIKKSRLLKHFGSVKKIQEASREELLSIKGITKKDAQILQNLQKT